MKWKKYRKKTETWMTLVETPEGLNAALDNAPSKIKAMIVHGAVMLNTQENWVCVRFPFWLAIDAEGFPYPISVQNHESSYEVAK